MKRFLAVLLILTFPFGLAACSKTRLNKMNQKYPQTTNPQKQKAKILQ